MLLLLIVMNNQHPRRSVAGFTLVELLITLAIAALIMSLGMPALMNMIQRSKLEGQARSLASMMVRSRSEAVKSGVETVVFYDDGEFVSFADVNGATLNDPPDGILGPISGQPQRSTDWILVRQRVTTPVSLSAPGAQDAVVGFANPDRPDGRAIFNPDGSLSAEGSLRLSDGRGNHLELVLGPRATGHVTLRKWDGSAWREQGEGGKSWQWN